MFQFESYFRLIVIHYSVNSITFVRSNVGIPDVYVRISYHVYTLMDAILGTMISCRRSVLSVDKFTLMSELWLCRRYINLVADMGVKL